MDNITLYQRWQLENHGDILPVYDNPFMPVDIDEQTNADGIDEERKFIEEEENWLNEQTY